MGPIRFALLFLLAPVSLSAATPAQRLRPKLIVQITMDQLRGDLLRDYAPALKDGFGRLIEEGYWIRRGNVDHGVTVSFPGHASLATGMYPSHHGLIANEYWTERDGKWVSEDFSNDSRYRILGDPASVGASPELMLAKTLGEWVKDADPKAKAIAMGSDNDIPVAYAGHRCDGMYIFDGRVNRFTTSSYYAQEVAGWVEKFNESELPGFEKQSWTLTVPEQSVRLASSTRTPLRGVASPVFPHDYKSESERGNGQRQSYAGWFSATPLKDEALFALAARAVDAEKLGQRGVTDSLAIDVDSTDQVGHRYGPRSLEQLDTLVRLDHAMGRFLRHLDEVLGKGSYVIALSADHGVADPPESKPGGYRISSAEIEALLDRVDAVAVADTGSPGDLKARIVATLKEADFIADAYTPERLSAPSDDGFVQLYQRSFRPSYTTDFPLWSEKPREHHPARYGIFVRFKEGMIFDKAVSVHGSPYAYDRDVPILFYGAGIRRGSEAQGANTVDVAPTLAAASQVPAPSGLDGHVLAQVLSGEGKPARQ
jgi:predicted AlkP superfamily pyrophosphatase or phosphodiesterase